jgi:hypothetical protein
MLRALRQSVRKKQRGVIITSMGGPCRQNDGFNRGEKGDLGIATQVFRLVFPKFCPSRVHELVRDRKGIHL